MTTTATADDVPQIFTYEAQTDDGRRLAGTIEATDAEAALDRLHAMRLRVIAVTPASQRVRSKALRGSDFLAFNQQLAQLTAAGMPLERGLRLIAGDIRSRRLKVTIERLASELESGTPLDQAFEKHREKFPPLYGRLVRAGVKSGDLSAVLLGLGRHLELVQRLRDVLWRALSYPLMVLVAMGFLLSFLGIVVLPRFVDVYSGLKVPLPGVTLVLLQVSRAAPVLLAITLAGLIGGPIVWRILQWLGYSGAVVERLVVPLPLVGPVLRANMAARWCDAVRLGVQAGLDLPGAIELAEDATRSGRLARDGRAMIDALAVGKPLTDARTGILPATVPATIQFASGYHDLGPTLQSLSEMYQRQAELRLNAIPEILTPLMVVLIAVLIGFVIVALMAPFIALLNGMSAGTFSGKRRW